MDETKRCGRSFGAPSSKLQTPRVAIASCVSRFLNILNHRNLYPVTNNVFLPISSSSTSAHQTLSIRPDLYILQIRRATKLTDTANHQITAYSDTLLCSPEPTITSIPYINSISQGHHTRLGKPGTKRIPRRTCHATSQCNRRRVS